MVFMDNFSIDNHISDKSRVGAHLINDILPSKIKPKINK